MGVVDKDTRIDKVFRPMGLSSTSEGRALSERVEGSGAGWKGSRRKTQVQDRGVPGAWVRPDTGGTHVPGPVGPCQTGPFLFQRTFVLVVVSEGGVRQGEMLGVSL